MIKKEYTFNMNELQGYKTLGVLEKTIEFDLVDGNEEIQSTFNHRYLLNPSDSNPTDSTEVQDKINEVFTYEVKAAYNLYLESLKPSAEELLEQFQNKFRLDRDALLKGVDIAINKAEDLGEDTKALRVYRQALRDATINWIMPESIS